MIMSCGRGPSVEFLEGECGSHSRCARGGRSDTKPDPLDASTSKGAEISNEVIAVLDVSDERELLLPGVDGEGVNFRSLRASVSQKSGVFDLWRSYLRLIESIFSSIAGVVGGFFPEA